MKREVGSGMFQSETHGNDILIITFKEKHLDSFVSNRLKVHIKETIDRYQKDIQLKQIIFSFKKVEVIDSSGIGMILGVWKYCALNNIGAQVCLAGCSEHIEKVMKLCKLDRIIHIYASQEEAIEKSDVGKFVY